MTDQVVDEIVRKVLAAMQARGLGADAELPQAKADAPPARVQPVYAPPSAQPKVQAAKTRTANTPRKVFLTAEMLQRRLDDDDGQGRTVELTPNEFLTPAAMDLASQRRLTVHKQPKTLARPAETTDLPPAEAAGRSRNATEGATLGLVVRQPNELVRGVLEGLDRDGILAVDFNRTDCWTVNMQMLCEAIVSGTLAGGMVMGPLAAEAVVLANKVRGIRAVQGVRPEGLAAAIARLAPNVLVLEHSSSTFHEIRTMLRMFADRGASIGQADAVMDAIEKLERA